MDKNIDRWSFVLLLLTSLISVLFGKSFSFNPFMLIALYFSFYRGLKSYIVNTALMGVVAFIIDQSYALEVFIVSISFLFITSLYSYFFRSPQKKYYSIITINAFFLLNVLFVNFSLENFVLVIINTIFQIVVLKSIEDFSLSLVDDNHVSSTISKSVVLMCLAVSGTFLEPVGLLTIRLILLLVALKLKNEVGLLAIFLTCIYTSLFLDYSFITLAAIFVSLFLVTILKRFEIPVYLISTIGLLLFSPTPLYLNISLYITIFSALICLSLSKAKLMDIFVFFMPYTMESSQKQRQYLAYTTGQIEALKNYVSLIDTTSEEKTDNPLDKAIYNIRHNVCHGCEHFKYCELKNNISSMFEEKISAKNKKLLNEKCISPYKMTLAIDTYYKVYKNEKHYYLKYKDANERYKYLLKSIESPLKNCSLSFNSEGKYSIERKILESGLHYYTLYTKNNDLIVTFNMENYEENVKDFDVFLKQNSAIQYEKEVKPQNLLTSTISVIYRAKPSIKYDIGVISQAFAPPFNGDNYFVLIKQNDLYICLCDGMGHGEKAEKCSKYLMTAVKAHLDLSTSFSDMVCDLNNMLLMRNEEESYSTMDLLKINLSSLSGRFVKAGAFLSYVIRNEEIISVVRHNLPLGIVGECTFETSEFQFERGDIIIIVSDGLGERIELDRKVLLIKDIADMSAYARNVYNRLLEKNSLSDDSTIITIKLL